ncbi:unnamed protein product [Amoebophrya sp. A120]|nr:unnamed protein product [Amoebophrya sp. A120]|eukprot:GSA120T00019186001.1
MLATTTTPPPTLTACSSPPPKRSGSKASSLSTPSRTPRDRRTTTDPPTTRKTTGTMIEQRLGSASKTKLSSSHLSSTPRYFFHLLFQSTFLSPKKFFQGAWPFILILLVELYDDWYTKFTAGYTCPPWYVPNASKISTEEADQLLQKATKAFFSDLQNLLKWILLGGFSDLGVADDGMIFRPYHDEIHDAVCPIGYEYDFPVSGTTWRWEFSPQYAAEVEMNHLTSALSYDPLNRFYFWVSMWPGCDVLLLLLLILFRRGAAELMLLVGVVVQGILPTTIKRSVNCYGFGNDKNFADTHVLEQMLCPLWLRPHTSCLDDCGMPSGHANVAYFYLAWGLPYFWRSGLLGGEGSSRTRANTKTKSAPSSSPESYSTTRAVETARTTAKNVVASLPTAVEPRPEVDTASGILLLAGAGSLSQPLLEESSCGENAIIDAGAEYRSRDSNTNNRRAAEDGGSRTTSDKTIARITVEDNDRTTTAFLAASPEQLMNTWSRGNDRNQSAKPVSAAFFPEEGAKNEAGYGSGVEISSSATIVLPASAARATSYRRGLILFVLFFLAVQPYVIVALGDHTPLQGLAGAVTGFLTGFSFYKFVLIDDVVLSFVESPIGRFLGFHDNYTFGARSGCTDIDSGKPPHFISTSASCQKNVAALSPAASTSVRGGQHVGIDVSAQESKPLSSPLLPANNGTGREAEQKHIGIQSQNLPHSTT